MSHVTSEQGETSHAQNFDLDTPILEFSDSHGCSSWTIGDAVTGLQIFGGIGSGKTSGSGRFIAMKYLSHGFGGLVLTVKPDEKAQWMDYCRLTGREKDLIIVEPGGEYFFNFLEYESSQRVNDISITDSVVQVLKTVIRAGEEKSGGKSEDPFWEAALDMLLFNVIDLCQLAYGKISIKQLYHIVTTAPKDAYVAKEDEKERKLTAFEKAFTAAKVNVKVQLDKYAASLTARELEHLRVTETFEATAMDVIPDAALLRQISEFFGNQYRYLSEKTRSIVDFSFSGFLFRLLKEPVYSLFCRHSSNFKPEDCLEGKIILINLPIKIYQKVGRDCQILFKYIWQRALEKRDVNINPRPVFLWADEAQHFLHEFDTEFQATARSSRICTVYLSQNLPNFYANMGSARYEHRVNAFLGTMATKLFHANADITTNKYASDLIGEGFSADNSHTLGMAGEMSISKSQSYKLFKMVRSENFVSLRTGGKRNNYTCDCYIHKQGQAFPSGQNFMKIKFKQSIQF